jgi:hypothetical protein
MLLTFMQQFLYLSFSAEKYLSSVFGFIRNKLAIGFLYKIILINIACYIISWASKSIHLLSYTYAKLLDSLKYV